MIREREIERAREREMTGEERERGMTGAEKKSKCLQRCLTLA